ncbi:hypothetical protein BDV32DRAFT_92958 [Aspergillus pseudonomiae]|nr:hypothetical protein BDV32DRAFT_92958 [Aspergillus pseudonomiae]
MDFFIAVNLVYKTGVSSLFCHPGGDVCKRYESALQRSRAVGGHLRTMPLPRRKRRMSNNICHPPQPSPDEAPRAAFLVG